MKIAEPYYSHHKIIMSERRLLTHDLSVCYGEVSPILTHPHVGKTWLWVSL